MARTSFFGRPLVFGVLLGGGLLLVLIAGGSIGYKATNDGKKRLPTLENMSMNVGNLTADSL